MIVRPTMDDTTKRAFAKSTKRIGTLSMSWYTKGGLGVDAEGVFLLDADGTRHPIGVGPNSQLVRLTVTHVDGLYGFQQGLPELFFADSDNYRVAMIPTAGFESTDFTEYATAAHITWHDFGERRVKDHGWYGGYPMAEQWTNLQGSQLAEADKKPGWIRRHHLH